MKTLIKNSIIAGVLIGLGCIVNLCSGNPILGSFLFSLGLMTVIFQERNLYTGKIGYWDFSVTNTRDLIVTVLFNFIGIGLTCYLFSAFSGITFDTSSIMLAKTSETWYNALFRSIGCGMLMYMAVEGYKRTKHVLAVIMPVMVFILCGFDHCVANFGYMCICGSLPFFVSLIPTLLIWILGNTIGSLLISKI